jgi:hypothetical protein
MNKTVRPLPDGYLKLLYLRTKIRWAEWMSRHSLRLGRRGLLIALGVFTTVFAAGCVLLIFSGGMPVSTNPAITPDQIISIRAPGPPNRPEALPDTVLQQQLAAFRRYMDNLESTESGRKIRDSLLKTRPGLMDSIAIAESLYINQNIKNHEKQ